MRLIAAALLTSLIATPLIAAGDAGKEKDRSGKEKRICRNAEPTGSRLVVRTCRSEAEWAVIDREAREHSGREVDRAQAMATSGGSGFSPN